MMRVISSPSISTTGFFDLDLGHHAPEIIGAAGGRPHLGHASTGGVS